jgi:predicted membrane-bound mannosyltransferase
MLALKNVGWPLTKKWNFKNENLKMGDQFFIFNSKFLILLAFILRVFRLGSQSLWFDEGWSWHLAMMPLAEMIEVTAGDRSPVLYYGLLHVWIGLVGQSELAMRYLSVFADVATVALLLAFGRGL